jgi:AcrR family transcriptional regulator
MPSPATSSPEKATRHYRGVSPDDRRRDRRDRLVAAGLELYGTRGIAATRVDDVCAAAGLTKRYFYESFSSPDELAEAVLEKAVDDLTVLIVPVIAAGGARDPRPAIATFMTALWDDPRLLRILFVETNYGSLTQHRHALVDRAVDTWLAADPQASTDPSEQAEQRLLAYAFTGSAVEVSLAWLSGRINLPAETITDQLVRIFQQITAPT